MCDSLDRKFYNIAKKSNNRNIKTATGISNNRGVKVSDEMFGIIEILNCKISYKQILNCLLKDDRNYNQYNYYPTIVIILESPHKSEFNSNHEAIGPLQDPTSRNNFRNNLPAMLFSYSNFDNFFSDGCYLTCAKLNPGLYKVVLLNAIQFQCSLGNLSGDVNKQKRDEIFKNCMKKNLFKEDFIERIRKTNPTIIINCCTGQKDHKVCGLQEIVQTLLNSHFSNCLLLYGYHPSSPWFSNGFRMAAK